MTARESRPVGSRTAFHKVHHDENDSQSTAPREPSAWLRGAVARRIRAVQGQGLDPHEPDGQLIIAPLGRVGGNDDHKCDRCHVDCRQGGRLWTGMVCAAPSLSLVIGLCRTCAGREGIEGCDSR